MADQFILRDVGDGVATLTLNRPDVLNSFNRAMAARLQADLSSVAADDGVRAVLLTGAGRAFCAGQDLAEAVPPEGIPRPDLGAIVRECYNPVIRAIRALEKPVVAAVNGVAAGAGANLAFACDIVLAADDASFIQSFSNVGLVPDSGGTWFLPRVVGLQRASALMMLAEKLPAPKAKEWGLVHEVVPAAALRETAASLARTLAARATRALGLTKRLLNASMARGFDEQLDLEAELQRQASLTTDYEEGVRAFLAKRRPNYSGC